MTRRAWAVAALVATMLTTAACGSGSSGSASSTTATPSGRMILATTTSTRDTGLLDTLVPAFEHAGKCSVKTVAVGSGQAIDLGARGQADVLLVHSPDAEQTFMQQGHGASRLAVMHNDFVLVGPPADPAKVSHAAGIVPALQAIARSKSPFASRADESGTNAKELKLWKQTGIAPSGSWYIKTGQGMGPTLTIASQKRAYTLSDRGTFLATKNLDSKILVQGGQPLQNPYHVIVVKHSGTNVGCARAFSRWITSAPTQRVIASFGKSRYGQALFHPDAPGQ
ncbi:MAG TPA: substrate-binding domain-containing protein [Solirubrobacteraceae bacterium]